MVLISCLFYLENRLKTPKIATDMMKYYNRLTKRLKSKNNDMNLYVKPTVYVFRVNND